MASHYLFYGFVLMFWYWHSISWQILHFIPFEERLYIRYVVNSFMVIKDTKGLLSFLLQPCLLVHTDHLLALQISWHNFLLLMPLKKDFILSVSALVKCFSGLVLICFTSFLNLPSQTLWFGFFPPFRNNLIFWRVFLYFFSALINHLGIFWSSIKHVCYVVCICSE